MTNELESVNEMIFNLNTQLMGFMDELNKSDGTIDIYALGDLLEYMVNMTSKLQDLILECKPENELH